MAYKILLVDDDKIILDSLSRSLKKAGYAVTSLGSGDAAISCSKENMFDCVIMDIDLPGIDGLTAIEKIRITCPQIKVIVISGYYAEVGDLYLPKPVTGAQLIKAINFLISEGREGP
jgi:two-component system, NtrC family, response regulator AtoC